MQFHDIRSVNSNQIRFFAEWFKNLHFSQPGFRVLVFGAYYSYVVIPCMINN